MQKDLLGQLEQENPDFHIFTVNKNLIEAGGLISVSCKLIRTLRVSATSQMIANLWGGEGRAAAAAADADAAFLHID